MGIGHSNPAGGSAGSTLSADLVKGGTSELDGDTIDIDSTWSNITPNTGGAAVTNAAHLGAILAGIDDALAAIGTPNAHAASHLNAGADTLTLTDAEIAAANKDGIAATASMRTLGTGAAQATAGNDARLSDARTPSSHAASHQNGGGDEVSVAGLSGTLADAQTAAAHTASHVRGGSDEIDGDHLDVDFTPSNYTPATTPAEAANVDDLAAHLQGIDTALATAGGSTVTTTGELELVDVITVTAAAQTVTFGAAGDGATKTALDGDTDEEYVIAGHWVAGAVPTTLLQLRPNAVSTNQSSSSVASIDGAAAATAEVAALDLAAMTVGNAGAACSFRATFHAKSGYARALHSVMGLTGDDAADTAVRTYGGGWRDTATNVTSLDVYCDTASGIGVGSKFYLYKRRTNVGNAVSAGALEYMDTIRVTTAGASFTFGTGGDGDVGRALDGNVDGEYVMYYRIKGSAGHFCDFRPNGVTTNQETFRATFQSSNATRATLQFAEVSDSGDTSFGELHFDARTTVAGVASKRHFRAYATLDAGTASFGRGFWGTWNETSTNVTSIDIVPSTGNIAAGSELVLYRRSRANVRADSADSYERHVTMMIQLAASTTEATVARPTYAGSLVGMTVQTESAVDAGTITVNVQVGGVTKLSAVLDAVTNTLNNRDVAAIGTYPVALTDEITVEVIGDASYSNAADAETEITVNVTLTNDSLYMQPQNGVVAETILAANAATISVTGLDGDAHGDYIVDFNLLVADSNTHVITAQPNSQASNLFGAYALSFDGTPTAVTTWQVVSSGAQATRQIIGRIQVQAARTVGAAGTAIRRKIQSLAGETFDASPYAANHNFAGHWANADANLTTFDLVDDQASGLLTGSRVTVRKA